MANRSANGLEFEAPIFQIEQQLAELERVTPRTEATENAIRDLRRQLAEVTAEIYANLTPWQTVRVARHDDRPQTLDYLQLVFNDFVELHGDRCFGDDRAILTGLAQVDQTKVMVVGHQKGRTTKERIACYFGCAHPEGYRKSLKKMQMAAKFGLPIICLIDTPGAYPGIGAEERGQSQAIAENMFEMSRLESPIICVVIGEGGSGGALGIGVGNRVAMLQHSYYSVISPEGCAGILWKSHIHAEKAATALRFTSRHLKDFGIVDDIIEEPLGGAHRDHRQMAIRLKSFLTRSLRDLKSLSTDQIRAGRYEKFRQMGRFLEQPATSNPPSYCEASAS